MKIRLIDVLKYHGDKNIHSIECGQGQGQGQHR